MGDAVESAARGICRGRILSNLRRDGRKETPEWIAKAENMGWHFFVSDAEAAVGRLRDDGYSVNKEE